MGSKTKTGFIKKMKERKKEKYRKKSTLFTLFFVVDVDAFQLP